MRIRRVLVPGAGAGGPRIRLSPDESHHLLRVLRLGSGDSVAVFDGEGREWDAAISSVDGGVATVDLGVERSDRTDPGLRVILYQGAVRPERMEWVVQKATEIGVAAIHPVTSRRAEAGKRAVSRLDRWRKIAAEACKQCGRRVVPALGDPVDLPPEPTLGTTTLLLHPGADSVPLRTLLVGQAPEEVWVAVGPEGGFDPDEVSVLNARGWVAAHLGPRTLRAETAGLVAAGLVLHSWGDLG